jgi:glycolate oxidase
MAAPKGASMAEDVTVPPSKVSQLLRGVHEIGKRHRISTATLGHVGDGNLHPNLLYDKNDPDECERMEKLPRRAFQAGRGPGRHLDRRARHRPGKGALYALWSTTRPPLGTMSAYQTAALDPNNILNPGQAGPGHGLMPGPKRQTWRNGRLF